MPVQPSRHVNSIGVVIVLAFMGGAALAMVPAGVGLLWLAVVVASTITLSVVVGSAAILAGFWDPLGNVATPTSLAVSGLPPPLVEPSAAEPQPAPARAPSPSPPACLRRSCRTQPEPGSRSSPPAGTRGSR